MDQFPNTYTAQEAAALILQAVHVLASTPALGLYVQPDPLLPNGVKIDMGRLVQDGEKLALQTAERALALRARGLDSCQGMKPEPAWAGFK